MPIARDGQTKVTHQLFVYFCLAYRYVSDLDPVPPHMRTWGGLVSNFTPSEPYACVYAF